MRARALAVRSAAAAVLLLAAWGAPPAATAPDPDQLRAAKALFFDHKYAEARKAWQGVLATSTGDDADAAAYWIARCSENLGESERALEEYGAFLARRPADPTLAEEARTSRVGLSARLYKEGKREDLAVLTQALADPSRTVRYFAALQLAGLGGDVGRPAIPVLKEILAREKDDDLVDRAKLALLKLDPAALAPARPDDDGPRSAGREASWLKVRIYKRGQARPEVSINLPVALAEVLFKSLPDDAKLELRRKGYDADNFWEKLKGLGRTEILSIEGEDGERVQIWLE